MQPYKLSGITTEGNAIQDARNATMKLLMAGKELITRDGCNNVVEGKRCQKCGSTKRYARKKSCVACAQEQNRNYYQTNPEWCREISRKWIQENPEKYHERRKKYRKDNSKKDSERFQKWYQTNSEKVRENNRKWKQENPEKVRENNRKWRQANPKKWQAIKQTSIRKTKAKRAGAEGSYTTQEWINLKEQYDNRCLCCGRHQSELNRVLEQDHIVPLSRGGSNLISNIQPLCHDCNGMGGKGTKCTDFRKTIFENQCTCLKLTTFQLGVR